MGIIPHRSCPFQFSTKNSISSHFQLVSDDYLLRVTIWYSDDPYSDPKNGTYDDSDLKSEYRYVRVMIKPLDEMDKLDQDLDKEFQALWDKINSLE